MAYGIDTVLHDFDERLTPESIDSLDGEAAHHASEFDWPAVERALGEAVEGLDTENRDRLAEALWRLVEFLIGYAPHGRHRIPPSTSYDSIGRRVLALGFVTGHPALEDASLRQIARASGGTAAALSSQVQRVTQFLGGFRNRAQHAHGHGKAPGHGKPSPTPHEP